MDSRLASCCPEMERLGWPCFRAVEDLFEANRFVSAVTAHPCKSAKVKRSLFSIRSNTLIFTHSYSYCVRSQIVLGVSMAIARTRHI